MIPSITRQQKSPYSCDSPKNACDFQTKRLWRVRVCEARERARDHAFAASCLASNTKTTELQPKALQMTLTFIQVEINSEKVGPTFFT